MVLNSSNLSGLIDANLCLNSSTNCIVDFIRSSLGSFQSFYERNVAENVLWCI